MRRLAEFMLHTVLQLSIPQSISKLSSRHVYVRGELEIIWIRCLNSKDVTADSNATPTSSHVSWEEEEVFSGATSTAGIRTRSWERVRIFVTVLCTYCV